MAIKKLTSSAPTSRPTLQITKVKVHEDGLPQEKTVVTTDALQSVVLIVAVPGWGKTEFLGDFPDNLMLCCEQGHKFVRGFKVIVDCWDYKKTDEHQESYQDGNGDVHMSFLEAVALIEASTRFRFITIDTIDSLVKMILDYYYDVKKVEHAEDIGEYGKGWDIAQNTPFRKAINRILKSGRGVGMTTHEKIVTANFSSGQKSKKETTLPAGVWLFLRGQIDIILHGKFGKRIPGSKHRQRIIETEGTEDMMAKNRGGILPGVYICDNGRQWKQFSGFFTNPKTVDIEMKRYEKIYGSVT